MTLPRARRSPGRIAAIAALIAAYAAVTAIMTYPYVNYDDLLGTSYGGDQRLIIWTLAWDNHALLSGESLFASNVFHPASDSLRYNEHLFALSLFTLPLAMAGASPIMAHHLVWWLTFPLNGLAAYVLYERFVRSPLAAFVGSLAFACSFYVMLHAHAHLHQIWLWPIPLSLLLLERWFDTPSAPRLGVWTGVVLLAMLTSWYVAIFILVANGVFGAVLLLTGTRGASSESGREWTMWRRRTVQLAVAAGVLALCVYPFARHYVSMTSSLTEVAGFSADVEAYLIPPENTVIGRLWRDNIDARPRSPYGEQTLFLGWLTLGLAAVGLGSVIGNRKIDRRAWLFPALAASGILLSFGPSLPVIGPSSLAPFGWLAALPGLDGVRVPARFAVLATLGLGGLAGIAAAAIERRLGTRGSVLLVLAVPLILVESFVVDFPAGKPESHPVPAIYSTPQVRSARALVSLPEYRGMPDWFLGGDYLYYSTEHGRPIVNGFGRAEPPGHAEAVDIVRRFPESVPAIRDLGVQYVVVHGSRFSDGGREIVEAARHRTDCRLVAQIGSDYLYEILEG